MKNDTVGDIYTGNTKGLQQWFDFVLTAGEPKDILTSEKIPISYTLAVLKTL